MSRPDPRSSTSAAYRIGNAVCWVLIAGALVFIGWRLSSVRSAKGARVVPDEAVANLLTRPLPVDESRSVRLEDSRAEFLVVFLFTPADCAACLPEMSDLSRLAKERKDIAVFAVMGYSNPAEARQTKESFGLDIPIVQDTHGELIEAIDPPRTPWKVVIRRADRRVLFESPPTVGSGEREAFIERLRQLGQGT